MLKGRESLRRIIGKRRRFLPNYSRILSSSTSNSSEDENEKVKTDDSSTRKAEIKSIDDNLEATTSEKSFVICPVCNHQICGDDQSINSHLDSCLVRGTKRKLSQRTLFQFNFCSNPKSSKCANEEIHTGIDIIQDNKPTNNDLYQLANTSISEVTCAEIQCEMTKTNEGAILVKSSLELDSITGHDHGAGCPEKSFVEDSRNEMIDAFSAPIESAEPNLDVEGMLRELSEMALETYIVGRKYVDASEVVSGASICFLRDPDNIKDPNAIKVVSPDSGSGGVLGFLPRELAQYLSPLIDKYHFNLEGVIASVPRNSLDIVPIKVMCLKTPSFDEVGENDIPMLKSLYINIFRLMKSGKTCPPAPTKYQQNFRLMIEEALRSNVDLFTDDEKSFLDSFRLMSDDSQRLFVRLYNRKGPWFRISSLSYTEILDYEQAVNELSDASYISAFGYKSELNDDDLEDLLNILTVNELGEILKTLKKDSKVGSRKKELITSLQSSYKDGLCPLLPSLIVDRTAMCVRISSVAESLLWRVQRLFFLDGEQDLSAFLLVDLQILKYPDYKCTITHPLFSARSDLLAYEEAIEVAQIIDQSLDEGDSRLVLRCIEIAESQLSGYDIMKDQSLILESESPFLKCFSAAWVNSKVVLLGVSFHEQERSYQEAIRLLKLLLNSFTSDGRRGYWTLRLSIDLEHVGCIEESLSVAEDGILDPWVRAGSKMALQRRVIRLGKPPRRWKTPNYASSVRRKITEVHIQGRPLDSKVGMKSRFYGEDGEQCGVEELALQFYSGDGGGWQGVHSESGIWLTIYGLLMWDIIFSDVPNTFRTKFQNAPLDMDSDYFYTTRKKIIEAHLQKIHDGMAEVILILSWELHVGTVCRGVNWERHSLSQLRAAVTCVGGPCLANLCRLLAQDYRSWTSGMPDLLLWRFHGDYSGEAKLVEVKGPRDRLSEQQRAWLLTLMDCGFNAEVCKVNPPAVA